MSYRISFTRSSKSQHEKLDTTVKDRIDKSFRQLVDYYDGKASKKPDVKGLSGKYYGLLRLRVGDYRIIFQVRGEEFVILVVQIVKRGDAYR
ncbi:type II toxin-antitoxin system RelE family toxin [Mesotoga prima]|uniref:type II toxin-antitoxin system RelE family toxin n=1 Tax=Mesotoga prima TaxID=1184387 RepID=UPI000A89E1DF|nr:type II toxin-antitoxin system mRNA interferase toxin, RelE/StbE family [Mesotoga prima]HNU62620.1 type II toxin-antitoxin system RelE/ParE family toxin [Methanofastidiosum sp.]HQC14898.1 type II toxin-antitoxin system RelE/ParE family toxin [Mesotoga prima]